MEFLTNYWWLIIIAIAFGSCGGYFLYNFYRLPNSTQLEAVKEWLLYAVTEAEKVLGGGTGQVKLRYVYDMFITKFPKLVKIIKFELFSNLVDEALDKFREMLKNNKDIKTYVEGDENK